MRKILLVEDDPTLREVYNLVLSTEPYLITTAINGKDALEKCAETQYDLILLDLMMPVLDGVGFLEKYVGDEIAPPTKVIVLSNLSSGQELTKAMSYGVQKSVLKADLSPRQLLATVRYELEA
jgi:CheY-like chemotaxis protein